MEAYKLVFVMEDVMTARRALSKPAVHIISPDVAQSRLPLHTSSRDRTHYAKCLLVLLLRLRLVC